MQYRITCLKLTILVCLALVSFSTVAQTTLDGMDRVGDWTDFENQSNEMPAQVWGSCDTDLADRIGISVEFDDGTAGTATYSGVSQLWNSSFGSGISADTSTGFLQNCTGMHFLFNNGSNLPMAWNSCNMTFASNFDLDYSENNGSHFRATTQGWVSAHFQTYCAAADAKVIPAVSPTSLVILGLLLAIAGFFGLRYRKQNA